MIIFNNSRKKHDNIDRRTDRRSDHDDHDDGRRHEARTVSRRRRQSTLRPIPIVGKSRVALIAVAILAIPVGLPATVAAAPPDSTSVDDAVTRLIDARSRANTVAEQIAATEADIEWLEDDVSSIEAQIEQRRIQIDKLRGGWFTQGADAEAHILASPFWRSIRTLGLGWVTAQVDALEQRQTELATKKRELADRRERLAEQQSAVAKEVQDLRSLEQEYLADSAVRNALAAKVSAANQQQAVLDRQAELAVQTELIAATGQEPASADRIPIAGRTGAGGKGSEPVAVIPEVGIMCPVVGGSAFSNGWGDPRSGGRRHEGVDMLAPIGTPLRAVIGGQARHRNNRLGGTTVSLVGDDGNRYYYAHLSSYEGGGGRVEAGEIVGYIGKSGAANGVPHLHFEIHPGGGAAVNPYRTVVAAGC